MRRRMVEIGSPGRRKGSTPKRWFVNIVEEDMWTAGLTEDIL